MKINHNKQYYSKHIKNSSHATVYCMITAACIDCDENTIQLNILNAPCKGVMAPQVVLQSLIHASLILVANNIFC